MRGPTRVAYGALSAAAVATVLGCAAVRAHAATDAQPARAPAASAHAAHQADEVMVHDHSPRHGGVVGMSGTRHVEVVLGDGTIRVYLSDLHRTPLPLAGVSGTATLRDAAAPQPPRTVKLAPRGDALAAPLPHLGGPTVDVRVDLATGTDPVLIEFTLPVTTAKP